MSQISSYNFEYPSRNPQTEPTHSSRKTLNLSLTASLIRDSGHDCLAIDLVHTQVKTSQRVASTFFRMQMAAVWQCATWRGKTRLNGAQAHCPQEAGSRCHAGHASLSPTLCDDKLHRVTETIRKDGFDALSSIDKKYFIRRYGHLWSHEKAKLNDKSLIAQTLEGFSEQLTERQTEESFYGTVAQEERNATYENPVSCNQIDSHLELHLRPLEDSLAEECRLAIKTPEEATETLVQHYKKFLREAIQNLTKRSENFDHFLSALQELHNLQQRIDQLVAEKLPLNELLLVYKQLIAKAEEFLLLKTVLSEKSSGTPNMCEFLKFFLPKTPYFVLRTMHKNYSSIELATAFELYLTQKHLLQLTPIPQKVEEKRNNLALRLLEANFQLAELEEIEKTIPVMAKMHFGISIDLEKSSPSQEEIGLELVEIAHSSAEETLPKRNLFASGAFSGLDKLGDPLF